ncbi:MAG: small multi-drug export protein [Candidatus Parcubacteria bacterium]|nr:small multi-drug export protein [Candidatus Parcubacteria bacterium]
MLPIGELRVSIPLGVISYHWPYWLAFLIGILGNLVFIYPLTWLLDTLLLKWVERGWFGYKLLQKILIRAQAKTKDAYQKWAKWGVGSGTNYCKKY